MVVELEEEQQQVVLGTSGIVGAAVAMPSIALVVVEEEALEMLKMGGMEWQAMEYLEVLEEVEALLEVDRGERVVIIT